jgi:hypothetical protein
MSSFARCNVQVEFSKLHTFGDIVRGLENSPEALISIVRKKLINSGYTVDDKEVADYKLDVSIVSMISHYDFLWEGFRGVSLEISNLDNGTSVKSSSQITIPFIARSLMARKELKSALKKLSKAIGNCE